MWRARVLTLFPDAFPGPLGVSLIARALVSSIWQLTVQDIRDSAFDNHKSVDDRPFGGGAGMIIRPDVLSQALATAKQKDGDKTPCLVMSARGKPLKQDRLRQLAGGDGVIIVCGRFEGVDERAIAANDLEEVCIGDYVLAGGEIAAMAVIEGCVRLLPGVMGEAESAVQESFENDLLEYPQYTRPRVWRDLAVPEVLLNGNHQQIRRWRLEQAERLTRQRRPDIYQRYKSKHYNSGSENERASPTV